MVITSICIPKQKKIESLSLSVECMAGKKLLAVTSLLSVLCSILKHHYISIKKMLKIYNPSILSKVTYFLLSVVLVFVSDRGVPNPMTPSQYQGKNGLSSTCIVSTQQLAVS